MKRLFASLILILALLPATSWAQRVDQLPGAAATGQATSSSPVSAGIAAVVNDNVISTADIVDREKLVMISANLPDTPETRQRLLVQILRSLVDEQLQMQEAKRIDVTVSKEDLQQALDRIAKENNLPGDLHSLIVSKGGSADALDQQMRASLMWNKVVQRELRPRVDVGDDEVDAAIERMRANAGKQEYAVSEIVLPVDTPKDEDQVKQFADNLVQQLKGGANFGAIARQFSQGTGAAAGGDIGWIQEGQLPQELNSVLVNMQSGAIEGPIRSASGYHILGLREKRTIAAGNGGNQDIKLNIQQLFRPLMSPTEKDMVMLEADRIRSTITSCDNMQGKLAEFPSWHWSNLGDTELSKLPSFISNTVRDQPVGQPSDTFASDKGALIVYVCERHIPDTNIDRNAIVNSIGTEKLELQARRLLRDLRRSAYIDIRLDKPAS